jgi:hypothetical protein
MHMRATVFSSRERQGCRINRVSYRIVERERCRTGFLPLREELEEGIRKTVVAPDQLVVDNQYGTAACVTPAAL